MKDNINKYNISHFLLIVSFKNERYTDWLIYYLWFKLFWHQKFVLKILLISNAEWRCKQKNWYWIGRRWRRQWNICWSTLNTGNIFWPFFSISQNKFVDHCWRLMKTKSHIGCNLCMWRKSIGGKESLQHYLRLWQKDVRIMEWKVCNCTLRKKTTKQNQLINL